MPGAYVYLKSYIGTIGALPFSNAVRKLIDRNEEHVSS